MPLTTREYDLAEEIDRLEAELQDIAESVASLQDGNPLKQDKLQRGQRLDVQLGGVRWALHTAPDDDGVSEWDDAVESVTLSGLTGAEMAMVEDKISHKRREHNEQSIGAGAVRVHSVAKGTVDAPYVDGSMSFQERLGAVSQLPNGYLRWAEARIDDLSRPEGNGDKRFGDYLADAQASET